MASFQERRFKAEYYQLKIKFIADYYSSIKNPESEEIDFKEDAKERTPFMNVCIKVINRLHPSKNKKKEKLDTDSKFKLLNLARRAEIMQYNNDECDTRIKQILTEASKLDTPWRKKAIEELLEKYKEAATDDKTSNSVKTSLYEAAYIRDVHFDNLYYRSQIAKNTIKILNRVLISLVSIVLISSAIFEFALHKEFLLGQFTDLWIVVIFGLLGAAFSTLLNLYKGNRLKNTIIKQLDSFILTVARLIIGASAGLIAFYLLNSGLIVIKGFNEEILNQSVTPNQKSFPVPLKLSMLALIFVAGFSERFVLNLVDKIVLQQQSDEKVQPEIKTLTEDNTLNRVLIRPGDNPQPEDKTLSENKPQTDN